MKQSEFIVRRFDNRNGTISWRVDGWLHGVRIRKNFKTREEAAAGKSALEIKNARLAAGMRPAAHEPRGSAAPRSRVGFRAAHRQGAHADRLSGLCARQLPRARGGKETRGGHYYVGPKEHERKQDLLSSAQLDRIRRELKHLLERHPKATVSELTGPRAGEVINLHLSDRAARAGRNNLSSLRQRIEGQRISDASHASRCLAQIMFGLDRRRPSGG